MALAKQTAERTLHHPFPAPSASLAVQEGFVEQQGAPHPPHQRPVRRWLRRTVGQLGQSCARALQLSSLACCHAPSPLGGALLFITMNAWIALCAGPSST